MNDETKKNVVAAPYPGDPAATPSRGGIPTGCASRLADAAGFLRGFLARPFEVAPVVPIDEPRLVVHAGSAESLADALRRRGLPAADVVVSGIPFWTLPCGSAQRVAAAIHANLAPGGRVVAYQCRCHLAGCLAPHLVPPPTAWEWRSLPPIRVSVWVKPAIGRATQGPPAADAAPASTSPNARLPVPRAHAGL